MNDFSCRYATGVCVEKPFVARFASSKVATWSYTLALNFDSSILHACYSVDEAKQIRDFLYFLKSVYSTFCPMAVIFYELSVELLHMLRIWFVHFLFVVPCNRYGPLVRFLGAHLWLCFLTF